jgi:hypothetical protein
MNANHVVVTSDKVNQTVLGGAYSHIAATDDEGEEYTYIVITNSEGREYSAVVVLDVSPWVEFYLGSEGRDGSYITGRGLGALEKTNLDFHDKVIGVASQEVSATGTVIHTYTLSWENRCDVIRYAHLRSMGML